MYLTIADDDGLKGPGHISKETKIAGPGDVKFHSFVARHLIGDAPADLHEVEAMIDAEPRRHLKFWARRAIFGGLTVFWGSVAYSFVA